MLFKILCLTAAGTVFYDYGLVGGFNWGLVSLQPYYTIRGTKPRPLPFPLINPTSQAKPPVHKKTKSYVNCVFNIAEGSSFSAVREISSSGADFTKGLKLSPFIG